MSVTTHPVFEAFLKKHINLNSTGRPIAVFDCDGTIIMGDIGEAMFFHQVENFQFYVSPADVWPEYPKREELRIQYESLVVLPEEKRVNDRRFVSFAERLLSWYFDQLAEGRTEKACADIVRLLAGYSLTEVRRIAEQTLEDELTSHSIERTIGQYRLPKGVRYIQESLDLMRQLNDFGFDVWVVSGSNQYAVEAVFSRIGFPPDRVIGIELEETGGRVGAEVKTPIPVREGKVQIVKQRFGRQPLIVVSDSIYDVPLFQFSADLKVLVNSRDVSSTAFFTNANIVKDETWVIIENPNPQESFTGPGQVIDLRPPRGKIPESPSVVR